MFCQKNTRSRSISYYRRCKSYLKWVFKFVYFWLTFWHLFFDRIWSNGSSGFIWFQCQICTRSQFSQRRYLSFVQTSVERLVERICKGSRRSDTWQVHNAKNEVCQHFFRETDVLFLSTSLLCASRCYFSSSPPDPDSKLGPFSAF